MAARTLAARRKLFEAHVEFSSALVFGMWKREQLQRNIGVEVEEYEQAALIGLWDATRLWKKGTGTGSGSSFKSFAVWRMRGSMRDFLRSHWYWRARWDKGTKPGEKNLPPLVVAIPKTGRREHPRVWNGARQDVSDALVRLLLARIPRKERELVRRHFLEGEKLGAIAKSWGVSQSRVTQILHGGEDHGGPGALELLHREATQGYAKLLRQQLEDVPERLPARTRRRDFGNKFEREEDT